ncbi:zinc finger protein 22-like [Hemicordylus capensis]|uniref:zinc finger protein 22-like n=1 Tax=Hemicordylus capensis TaxID=884348 RepID=UPI0023033DD1|nr:zinc finger protein 22-like [Hemicordylus capensis]
MIYLGKSNYDFTCSYPPFSCLLLCQVFHFQFNWTWFPGLEFHICLIQRMSCVWDSLVLPTGKGWLIINEGKRNAPEESERVGSGWKSKRGMEEDVFQFYKQKNASEDPSRAVRKQEIYQMERVDASLLCGSGYKDFRDTAVQQRIHPGKRQNISHSYGKTKRPLRRGKSQMCLISRRSFLHSSDLLTHQRIHVDERMYECLDCGKEFSRKFNLQRHQRIHAGEKPYYCLDCGKTFGCSWQLRVHRRIHTGEKPYKCTYCGKEFGRSSNLARHQLIHTREKRYACSECGKGFSQKFYLNKHRRIHTCKMQVNTQWVEKAAV